LLKFEVEKRLRFFSLILFLAFILKYNYLMLHIFYAPSLTALIIRNLFFIIFYLKFVEPLLISKKIRQRLFLMLIIFTIFVLSNHWYNRYFGNFLSISDIFAGEGTGQFSMYEVLFTHIFKYWDVIFILDIVLLGITGFNSLPDLNLVKDWGFWKLSLKEIPIKNTTAFALIILLLLVQIVAGSYIMGGKSPAELYRSGSSYLASVYGILPLYTIEAYSYITREEEKPRPELKNIPYYKKQRQLSGIQKLPDKTNVILIQVESLDAKVLDYSKQGEQITPFLNKLKDQSLYFENFYAQKVNGSFDADLSTLTSLYPVNRSYVFRDIDLSAFQSLPLLLKEKNYQTLAFHNNDRNFFNRAEAYPDLGFDRFYSQRYFEENIYPVPEARGLGVNDYDYFNQAAEIIKEKAAAEKPFFAYLISLTSHTTFNFYPKTAVKEFAGVKNNLVQNYFRSINFTDAAIENFVNKLKEAGIMKNTLLVIYADHESEIKSIEYESDSDFTLWRNVKVPYHIPLIIKHPEIKNRTIKREGTTTDIAPTVLDLLGYQELPDQFVGSSLFLEEENPILFLHETPHLLKDGQLYIKELDQIIKVGHLKNQEKEITFSEAKINEITEIIDYMRSIFMINQGEIFKEVE